MTNTKHTPGPCSYDGFGINGPDEYKTRIATFSQHANRKELNDVYGPLFAAAPTMYSFVLKHAEAGNDEAQRILEQVNG